MTASPQSTSPRATVVVPVRDNRDGILRCLAGIESQGLDLEVIVVDDGSTDGTPEVAVKAGARVVSSSAPGAAAARNTGVQAARGAVVLFTDADCIPLPGWAAGLIQAVEEDGVVAAKGIYRSRQTSVTARFVQTEYEERYDRMRAHGDIDFLDTYSLAVRRDDLLAIGGFDEGFSGASVEDQEMSFRLQGRGRFLLVETAVVDHQHARSPQCYARKKLHIGRGKATLLRRHPKRIQGDSHTPDMLRYQVGAVLLGLAVAPFTYWWSELRIIVALALLSPLALSLPLLRRTLASPGLRCIPASIALVLIRGWTLSLGFAWGVLSPSTRLSHQCGAQIRNPADCEPATPAVEVETRDVVQSG